MFKVISLKGSYLAFFSSFQQKSFMLNGDNGENGECFGHVYLCVKSYQKDLSCEETHSALMVSVLMARDNCDFSTV